MIGDDEMMLKEGERGEREKDCGHFSTDMAFGNGIRMLLDEPSSIIVH